MHGAGDGNGFTTMVKLLKSDHCYVPHRMHHRDTRHSRGLDCTHARLPRSLLPQGSHTTARCLRGLAARFCRARSRCDGPGAFVAIAPPAPLITAAATPAPAPAPAPAPPTPAPAALLSRGTPRGWWNVWVVNTTLVARRSLGVASAPPCKPPPHSAVSEYGIQLDMQTIGSRSFTTVGRFPL